MINNNMGKIKQLEDFENKLLIAIHGDDYYTLRLTIKGDQVHLKFGLPMHHIGDYLDGEYYMDNDEYTDEYSTRYANDDVFVEGDPIDGEPDDQTIDIDSIQVSDDTIYFDTDDGVEVSAYIPYGKVKIIKSYDFNTIDSYK